MGKGDKRSRRGKISAGSYGKTRPKNKKAVYTATAAAASEEKVAKKRVPKRVPANAAE